MPLQSHNSEGIKHYLLTDAYSGEVIDDERAGKTADILIHDMMIFSERDGRLSVTDAKTKLALQEIVDSHEYRYGEMFHFGKIASISPIFENIASNEDTVFESIAL